MTQAQADMAQQMRDNANSIVEGILAQEDVMKEQAEIDKQRAEAQAAIEAEKAQNIDATTQAVEATGTAADGTTDSLSANADAAAVNTQAVQTTTQAVVETTAAINEEINRQIAFTEQIWKSVEAQNALNTAAGGGSSASGTPSMDSGGVGIAGVPYMIGTGAQPEMFIPKTNGVFIPNADKKMGDKNIVVNITNPKGETSERSIFRTLRQLSYLGVAS